MASFPIARLILMVIRQVSKPISKIIRVRAEKSEFVKKYITLPPANLYIWMEKTVKVKMFGKAPTQSATYVEDKAVKLGATLLSEAFIFTVAASFVTLEFKRARRKAQEKEKRRLLDETRFRQDIKDQCIISEEQELEIRELTKAMDRVENLVQEIEIRRLELSGHRDK